MQEFIEFLVNNISIIISAIALIISIINLISNIKSNWKKLDIGMNNYTHSLVDDKEFYIFNIELINKSRLPISISEMIIEINKKEYKINKAPKLLAERDRKRGKEIIRHAEVHSVAFPINLQGLSSQQAFIVMNGPKSIDDKKNKVIINTNRGKIVKHIEFGNYSQNTKCFIDYNEDYYVNY